ncbi:GCN5 family acetyltransferase [Streptomyces canus]|uniref:GCN5 family acetyltransferase n=1 Tax=Streptomyces canus TaxID=58343 RepID=A0A101SFT3_9ACTN|nr:MULTISPECIES: GNAT family N-acetyltransferase [Streptomyces]KUN72818.1 GCN5 family acetyltransferase [Streptomyces canus]MDI5905346.1 GNAT family N-acetyltransferase [Streptomyces sp. 12257]
MPKDLLLVRAQGLWQQLASAPVSFGAAGEVSVVVSPRSRFCPPGWVGIVVLGGAAIVTAPSEEAAARIRKAVVELPADELTDPEAVGKVLPIGEVLGPAALAHVAADGFRPSASAELRVEELPAGHASLDALEQAAGAEDAGEAGLADITSPAFVLRVDGQVVAAAGYRAWPRSTAHVSVLTSPDWRGKGLARATGSAAVRYALAQDLLPQWRARIPASRKAAIALGFSELGFQLSIRLV